MIDTDKLELIDTGDGIPLTKCEQNLYEGLADLIDGVYTGFIEPRLRDALADMSELVAEVKHLQHSYNMAVKQLQNTRLWIAKYEGVLKEMANQASFVKCSALNIDEWIEGVRL